MQSILTDELINELCNHIQDGAYRSVACQKLHLNYETLKSWMKKGKKGVEPYNQLYQQIIQAEAEAEIRKLGIIQNAANEYTQTTQKTSVDADGRTKTEETKSTHRGDWRAATWFLERRFPDRWGQPKVDLLEATKTFVACGILPEECLNLGADEFRTFMQQYRQSIAQSLQKIPTDDN